MKISAIIRICVWSLIAGLLTVALVHGIIFDGEPRSILQGGYRFADVHTYSVGDTTLDAKSVEGIDVEWISGSIRISATEGDQIVVRETKVADPANALRWRIRDGELQIRYCKPRRFGVKTVAKDLEILLPESMMTNADGIRDISIENVSAQIHLSGLNINESLDIESMSGQIYIQNAIIRDIDLENVSGTVIIDQCKIRNIEVSTVSGQVTVDGEVNQINISGVSAQLNVASTICPDLISAETVSGKINLAIPSDSQFTVSMDSLNGHFSAPDFNVSALGTGRYVCGSGSALFDIESVSGHVDIRKISPAD